MRQIHLDQEIRLRFPRRGPEFDDGVEVGILAVLMTQGDPVITRWISETCLQQLQALAPQLSYRAVSEPSSEPGLVKVTLTSSRVRPKLSLVQ